MCITMGLVNMGPEQQHVYNDGPREYGDRTATCV